MEKLAATAAAVVLGTAVEPAVMVAMAQALLRLAREAAAAMAPQIQVLAPGHLEERVARVGIVSLGVVAPAVLAAAVAKAEPPVGMAPPEWGGRVERAATAIRGVREGTEAEVATRHLLSRAAKEVKAAREGKVKPRVALVARAVRVATLPEMVALVAPAAKAALAPVKAAMEAMAGAEEEAAVTAGPEASEASGAVQPKTAITALTALAGVVAGQ
jgi:hypothetical protein